MTAISTEKKITRSTLKSFVAKNRDSLMIKVDSKFDGMTDCVERCENRGFSSVRSSDGFDKNTLGVQGLWLVLGGGDRLSRFEENGLVGIRCYNCCGSWTVAIPA